MKATFFNNIIFFLILILSFEAKSQNSFPEYLTGLWKVENENLYEHWDKLNNNLLKGFSYTIINGEIKVTEYLEISKSDKFIYKATVINQNQGKTIEFTHKQSDSGLVFENLNHDFPKIIRYQKHSNSEIKVEISDGKQKKFSYKQIKQNSMDTSNNNPQYDKNLAEKLRADKYGMKNYFLVILKTGTNLTTDQDSISQSFRGHMENITRLVKEKKLVVAGPFKKNDKNYRGIFILDHLNTQEEVIELLMTDSAIKNKFLDFEIYPWYGSAALPEYLPAADKIWQEKP